MDAESDSVVAGSEDEDSMIMRKPEDDPMNGYSNATSTIGNFTTMNGQETFNIESFGNSAIPRLDGSSSGAPAPPKPRPRPRPIPRKSKPSTTTVPADTSFSTTSASSVQPISEPVPVPDVQPELDLSFSLGAAERAKLRARRISKPLSVPESQVIDITDESDDEIALPPPRATKKVKTKHDKAGSGEGVGAGAGAGDTTLDSISAAHIPLPSSSLPPSSPFPSPLRRAKRKRPAEELDMHPPIPPLFFADTAIESLASELPGADSMSIASGSLSGKEKKAKKKVLGEEEDWDTLLEEVVPKKKGKKAVMDWDAPLEEIMPKKKAKKKAVDDDDEDWDAAPKKKKVSKKKAAVVEGSGEGTAAAKKKAPRKRQAVAEVSLPPTAVPPVPQLAVQEVVMSFVPPSIPDRAPSSDPGEEDELRLPDLSAPSPPPAPASVPEPEPIPDPVPEPAPAPAKVKGKGKAIEPIAGAGELEAEVVPPKKGKKATKRAVIGSDDDEPAPVPAAKKGGKKGKKASTTVVEDAPAPVGRPGSASLPATPTKHNENLQPSPSPSTHEPLTSSASGSGAVTTPVPRPSAPRSSMNRESSALPPSYLANKQYSIARSKSGVSDLLRRTSSPASKSYSPYSKMSKTVLRKFAPLHPNRRTPPPPPPPPPPKKKTKKELEREERWEEELEDEVEGWYALGEDERARWRRAKRDKELGYDD